ncbi:hypothetical protein [Coleofasciculus sp. FACHB-SPT36]|nr:hypothetical protein [Coleofasciculus sp. FACHB-SPT36]
MPYLFVERSLIAAKLVHLVTRQQEMREKKAIASLFIYDCPKSI